MTEMETQQPTNVDNWIVEMARKTLDRLTATEVPTAITPRDAFIVVASRAIVERLFCDDAGADDEEKERLEEARSQVRFILDSLLEDRYGART